MAKKVSRGYVYARPITCSHDSSFSRSGRVLRIHHYRHVLASWCRHFAQNIRRCRTSAYLRKRKGASCLGSLHRTCLLAAALKCLHTYILISQAYALYRTRLPTTIIHHALYLLHRLKARYPSARGTSSSPHRLFLSALMLSSKIQMDDTYSNRSWAIVGGNFFALREVNQMERELFAFLEWNAVVSKAELEAYSETIDADWAFVKTRHGLQAARARTAPIPSTSTEQPVIGKRRRSDTTYTEQAIEKAQALRHKRAADAAIALLQPTQGTAASYRDQINSRYGQEASQESSVCSSFVSSPSSDKFFQYNSSSSYGTSPETSSPHSSKGGPITPEDHETLSRFSNSVNVADISLPPSRQPSWSALIHAKNSLPKSFTYSAGGIMSNVSA